MNHTIKNRGNKADLKNFEKELLKNGILKLAFLKQEDIKDLSLEQFIIKFFKEWNSTKNTYYTSPKRGLQTEAGRKRSTGDMFRICKYYYPKCTFIEVLKIMDNLPNRAGITCNICNTINKRVYYKDNRTDWVTGKQLDKGLICSLTNKDEFGRLPGEYLKIK